MKRLGEVLHVFEKNQMIIIQSEKIINKIIKKKVVDVNINYIGKIYDIFGPIDHPYIIIKLNNNIKNPKNLCGKKLYLYEKKITKRKR
ncbi:MAG: H/ACA ribonucleoprotein complex subunit GAR1 [Candidatus Helarchaeota archaeon]